MIFKYRLTGNFKEDDSTFIEVVDSTGNLFFAKVATGAITTKLTSAFKRKTKNKLYGLVVYLKGDVEQHNAYLVSFVSEQPGGVMLFEQFTVNESDDVLEITKDTEKSEFNLLGETAEKYLKDITDICDTLTSTLSKMEPIIVAASALTGIPYQPSITTLTKVTTDLQKLKQQKILSKNIKFS
jgi:hypothetical protein